MVDPSSNLHYDNMLFAQIDVVYSALDSLGYRKLLVHISGTGWPSKGDLDEAGANLKNAKNYNGNLIKMAMSYSVLFFVSFVIQFRDLKLQDDKVVAFQDINPSAFRHYLVVPVAHIPIVKYLQRKIDDYSWVSHMLQVGKTLLNRDAPQSQQYSWAESCLFHAYLD
ncbi:Glucan endo-1,3-beta-glucosidase 11 [Glycine soja]